MMTAFLHVSSQLSKVFLVQSDLRLRYSRPGVAKENMGRAAEAKRSYQVMTLSAIGEAETPAGGSDCIRCNVTVSSALDLFGGRWLVCLKA